MIHLQRHVGKSTMYEFKKKVSQAMERLEKSFVQINVFLSDYSGIQYRASQRNKKELM